MRTEHRLLAIASLICFACQVRGDVHPISDYVWRSTAIGDCRFKTSPNGGRGKGGVFVVEKVLAGSEIRVRQEFSPQNIVQSPGDNARFVVFFMEGDHFIRPFGAVQIGGPIRAKYVEQLIHAKEALPRITVRLHLEHLRSTDGEVRRDCIRSLLDLHVCESAAFKQTVKETDFRVLRTLAKDQAIEPEARAIAYLALGVRDETWQLPFFQETLQDSSAINVVATKPFWIGFLSVSSHDALISAEGLFSNPRTSYHPQKAAFRAIDAEFRKRPELKKSDAAAKAVSALIDIDEFAAAAINHLCDGKRFDRTERVLTANRQNDLIRRAMLRFAIQSPHPSAARYVELERLRDEHLVEELVLRFHQNPNRRSDE